MATTTTSMNLETVTVNGSVFIIDPIPSMKKGTNSCMPSTSSSSEDASMNSGNTSHGEVIIGVLSKVLNRLIDVNKALEDMNLLRLQQQQQQIHAMSGGNNMFATPAAILNPMKYTKFQSSSEPSVTIHAYLDRIRTYSKCSDACFILCLIYIDRLIERKQIVLSKLNIHRIVITCMLVAAKFMDDFYYNNAYFAKLGGISTAEMNGLELEFLLFIGFNLNVSVEQFSVYYKELTSFIHSPSLSPVVDNTSNNSNDQKSLGVSRIVCSRVPEVIPSPPQQQLHRNVITTPTSIVSTNDYNNNGTTYPPLKGQCDNIIHYNQNNFNQCIVSNHNYTTSTNGNTNNTLNTNIAGNSHVSNSNQCSSSSSYTPSNQTKSRSLNSDYFRGDGTSEQIQYSAASSNYGMVGSVSTVSSGNSSLNPSPLVVRGSYGNNSGYLQDSAPTYVHPIVTAPSSHVPISVKTCSVDSSDGSYAFDGYLFDSNGVASPCGIGDMVTTPTSLYPPSQYPNKNIHQSNDHYSYDYTASQLGCGYEEGSSGEINSSSAFHTNANFSGSHQVHNVRTVTPPAIHNNFNHNYFGNSSTSCSNKKQYMQSHHNSSHHHQQQRSQQPYHHGHHHHIPAPPSNFNRHNTTHHSSHLHNPPHQSQPLHYSNNHLHQNLSSYNNNNINCSAHRANIGDSIDHSFIVAPVPVNVSIGGLYGMRY